MLQVKSMFEKKEDSLLLLAFAYLKQWGKDTSIERVASEKARLDRVISDVYCNTKLDIDYNQFALKFIKENGRKIVFENDFSYDIPYSDDSYELNIETIIDKLQRKSKGSKY